jgi:hypothetical protein
VLAAWTIVKKPDDLFLLLWIFAIFSEIIEVAIKKFQNFATMQNFRHKNKGCYVAFYIINLDK